MIIAIVALILFGWAVVYGGDNDPEWYDFV